MAEHRILVVDDEPFNVEYLDQELTDRGYTVETAHDGNEALAKVDAAPPDLILLDVLMPGIDGIEVCRRLKDDEGTRLIPVIIMTALTDQESRTRGVEAGADDFLSKPVDDRELFARIRNALRLKTELDVRSEELRTAAEQIAHLGKHDEEVAVLVAIGGDTADLERFAAEVTAREGVDGQAPAAAATAIFRGGEPGESLRLALGTALALHDSSLSLGIAVGSALVGAERTSGDHGHEWVIGVEGPAVAEASVAAGTSEPGLVLGGPSVIEHLSTAYQATSTAEIDSMKIYRISAAGGDTDVPAHEIEFPAEFTSLLPVLTEAWGITDLYATKSLSGKSGARVLVVDISMADFSGQAILKLEEVDEVDEAEEVEAERHRRALDRGGDYAAARLPRLVKFLAHDGATATLSTIAAGGLEYCQAWFRMPYEHQLASAERVSHDTLEGWNGDYRLEPGLIGPTVLLTRWLGYRLDPSTSRLDTVLDGLFGLDALTPTFFLDGVWYPNPVVFARSLGEITTEPALRAAVGQMHGDMHGYNVLTSHRRTDVSDYFLIDLAYYQEENFLFFDHGYFELAYLLRTREGVTPARWLELLSAAFGGGAVNADDIGIIRIVDAIRDGQRRWIADHEENRASYMESQMLLGQIGAGLNYANKRVPPDMKIQALLYAAVAVREFVDLHGLEWPRDGQVATIAG